MNWQSAVQDRLGDRCAASKSSKRSDTSEKGYSRLGGALRILPNRTALLEIARVHLGRLHFEAIFYIFYLFPNVYV
jgi:hypothetical protein